MRALRIIVWGGVAFAAFYTLQVLTVGVSFYYPAPLDNDPLKRPVQVASVSSNSIVLADGRVVLMEFFTSPVPLAEVVRQSGFRIDLETADSASVGVFVKKKRFTCRTHARGVIIPLFRSEYPGYYRHPIGYGSLR